VPEAAVAPPDRALRTLRLAYQAIRDAFDLTRRDDSEKSPHDMTVPKRPNPQQNQYLPPFQRNPAWNAPCIFRQLPPYLLEIHSILEAAFS